MPIPSYAEGVPRNRLVTLICKQDCNKTRYAEVSDANWKKDDHKNNVGTFATCLKCGKRGHDTYNWIPV